MLPQGLLAFAGVSFLILLVRIIICSFSQLSGFELAQRLGGRRVERRTDSAAELRLLNVVEEMALASGIPVPYVFVFDEIASINALAAGSRPEDAAVAVTAGCLENLTREELQGVIAHEFSHILNGDMRLNLKMVSLLGPIMLMSTNCKACFMGLDPENDQWLSRLTSRVFYVYGLAGSLLGRLIQCLISREREYLADASAVRFTRNPAGFVSALIKIARQKTAPVFTSQDAVVASHMFFSSVDASRFSTHPPIAERIRRIDPSLGGRGLPALKTKDASLADVLAPNQTPGAVLDFENRKIPGPARFIHFRPESLAAGESLLASLPRELRFEINNPLGASALVCALLLSRHPQQRQRQLAALKNQAADSLTEQVNRLAELIAHQDPTCRLSLLDLAMPALRALDHDQQKKLQVLMQALIAADGKSSLFKLAVKKAVASRLAGLEKPKASADRSLENEMLAVLSALAGIGHRSPEAADAAFNAALEALGEKGASGRFKRSGPLTLDELSHALDRLAAAAPGVKRIFLEACAACALYDGELRPAAAVLLRAVCYALGVPLPLFVKDKELTAWIGNPMNSKRP